MQAVSISVSWAISQYRAVLSTIAMRTGIVGPVKLPKESPEVISYLRSIGIGRNVDSYA